MGRLKENTILKSVISFLDLKDTSELETLIKKKNNILNDGTSGVIWLIYYLIKEKQSASLLGSNEKEKILVRQWLEYVSTYLNHFPDIPANESHSMVKEVNTALSNRTFLSGNKKTIADLILYYILHSVVSQFSFYEKEEFIHLSRWMDCLQHDERIRQKNTFLIFSRTLLYH